jgi:hypothetical protein
MCGKLICDQCNGNGYRYIWEDADEKKKIAIDCAKCNNQGEIPIEIPNTELDIMPERKQ